MPDHQVKLVLSGSYISAMRRLTTADQPLHGRKTGTLAFSPFSYLDAAKFVPGYSARGTAWWRTPRSRPTRPARSPRPGRGHCGERRGPRAADPGGRLAEEGARLFDAFLKDAGVHSSIVRAVAAGEQKWSKITSRVGKGSASLSRPLEWLRGMDIIDRVIPATEPPPGNPKKAMYRITGPVSGILASVRSPIRATGADDLREPGDLIGRTSSPPTSIRIWAPCSSLFVERSLAADSMCPDAFQPVRVGEWWSDDSTEQVDVVA